MIESKNLEGESQSPAGGGNAGGEVVPFPTPNACVTVPPGYLDRDGLDHLPPVEWLVQDTLQSRTASEIYGKYGVGKTILALDLALCVATGTPWHDRKVQPGKVVYVYAEGAEGLHSRVVAWEKRFYDGQRIPNDRILFKPEPVDLGDAKARRKLVADARVWSPAEDPALVVFDTVFECSGEVNLNDGKDMKKITDAVSDTRRQMPSAHVLLVHHDTKAGRSGGLGSVHLPGALWSLFELKEYGGNLQFICLKQRNNSKEPAQATFALEAVSITAVDGETQTAAVARKVRGGVNERSNQKSPTDHKAMLEALGSFGDKGASSNDWKTACRSSGVRIGNDAFRGIRNGFVGAEDALFIEGRYYLPQHAPQTRSAR